MLFLNPLAAKKELDQLRPNKNDLNDAKNLALTQFIFERPKHYVQAPIYLELQDMSRFYQQLTRNIVQTKNRLHRVLQLTFPEIEHLFSSTDNHLYLEILSAFPHAQLAHHDLRTLADTVQSIASQHIGQNRLNRIVHKLSELARQSAPAISVSSHDVYQVRYYATRLLALSQERKNLLADLVQKAKSLPEYAISLSIPGFSDKTVVSLIAEIGDLNRFKTSNQLNAFIGIDLRFNDSGQYQSSV